MIRPHGRANVDPAAPQAFGVCDRDGMVYNYRDLIKQFEWRGPRLMWTGILVCRRCLDVPQDQLRPVVLPQDPVPIKNPRPENFVAEDGNMGWTPYGIWVGDIPSPYQAILGTQDGGAVDTEAGPPIYSDLQPSKITVLQEIVDLSGVPLNNSIQDVSTWLFQPMTSQVLRPANPNRNYIAIFNPGPSTIGIAVAPPANLNSPLTTIALGGGGALFWATAKTPSNPTPLGAIYVTGSTQLAPIWVWEGALSASTEGFIVTETGVPITTESGQPIEIEP